MTIKTNKFHIHIEHDMDLAGNILRWLHDNNVMEVRKHTHREGKSWYFRRTRFTIKYYDGCADIDIYYLSVQRIVKMISELNLEDIIINMDTEIIK